jgi:hypothetical protein
MDISIETAKRFWIEAQGLKKVAKGAGIAGVAAALTSLTIGFYPEFLQAPQFVPFVTGAYATALNFLRKFLLTYDIDITRLGGE